jgi:hypothetical protein
MNGLATRGESVTDKVTFQIRRLDSFGIVGGDGSRESDYERETKNLSVHWDIHGDLAHRKHYRIGEARVGAKPTVGLSARVSCCGRSVDRRCGTYHQHIRLYVQEQKGVEPTNEGLSICR